MEKRKEKKRKKDRSLHGKKISAYVFRRLGQGLVRGNGADEAAGLGVVEFLGTGGFVGFDGVEVGKEGEDPGDGDGVEG